VTPSDDEPLLAALGRIEVTEADLAKRRWLALGPGSVRGGTHGSDVRPPEPAERAWLARRLATLTSPLERRALDLAEEALGLEAVGAAYQRLGLTRQRTLRFAMGVSDPAGFALIEQSSPGLSFVGLADLTRLYVTSADQAARAAAALGLAAAAVELGRGRGQTLLLVPADLGPAFGEAGYEALGPRVEIVLTRAAVARLAGHLRVRA